MKRSFVASAVAAVLVLALTGCVESGRGDRSRALGPALDCPVAPNDGVTGAVRIGYQNIANGDLIVKDTGLLETCLPEAKITWSKFDSGATVIQAFGAGSLDLGLLGSAAAARAISAPLNLDVRAIWIHDVIGPAESLIVKDPAITTVAGLRGKKIAVPFASTSHYSLLAALHAAGIEHDVTLVNLQPDAILAAWKDSGVDAAFIWDPTLGELRRGGHVVNSAADTAAAGAPTFDLEGARSDFVAANPAFLTVWTAVQNWAVHQLISDPQGAATHVAAQLGTDVDAARRQLAGYTYPDAATQAGPAYLGGQLGADLRSTAQFLLGQGQIQGLAAPRRYHDAVYAQAAATVGGAR
ncbi:ABC transporter substrate-binding protein [Nocardia sp. NPDC052254]|uniref:taurine ABC transporter substrate-binding protein n=1 Tax=Nocardia sp. NPDC052254 TaxID=3155681 RepID=UPI00342290F2